MKRTEVERWSHNNRAIISKTSPFHRVSRWLVVAEVDSENSPMMLTQSNRDKRGKRWTKKCESLVENSIKSKFVDLWKRFLKKKSKVLTFVSWREEVNRSSWMKIKWMFYSLEAIRSNLNKQSLFILGNWNEDLTLIVHQQCPKSIEKN